MKKVAVLPDPPFYDDEEREIIEDLRKGVYKSAPNQKERITELKEVAANTLRRKSVTIRVQERVIEDLKSIALDEGLPYQTLISSILYKFTSGKLKDLR
jgi:predicted DNA binding CopG/RHH family protein